MLTVWIFLFNDLRPYSGGLCTSCVCNWNTDMVEHCCLGYINPKYCQQNLYLLSKNSIRIWGCKSSRAKGDFGVYVELFQWPKLYLFISILFRNIAKCHMNLILLSLSIFYSETSLKLANLLCQSVYWHFWEAIL